MKRIQLNIKRPLGLACLLFSLLLLGVQSVKGVAEERHLFFPKEVILTGKVYQKELGGGQEGSAQIIYLKSVTEESMTKDGKRVLGSDSRGEGDGVICYLKRGQPEPELGSIVRVSGRCEAFQRATNPGQFDSYLYYQILGISYRLFQTNILAKTTKYNKTAESLYQIRKSLAGLLDMGLPPEEAAVMKTMLLGEKGAIDKELKALYQRNGIAHILAISGLHISILGIGLYRLLIRVGMPVKVSGILSALFLIGYGGMIGFSPSAVRAIIMFLLHILAKMLRRTYDMLSALGVAAVLLLLEQPLYLYHSGFMFSFCCLLGIGMLMPALTGGKTVERSSQAGKALLQAALQALGGGVVMTIITLPIYLWYYYQFPVYSIFLNLLIVPLMNLLMMAGLLLLPLQYAWDFGTFPISSFISGALQIYEKACCFCQSLPGYLYTPGRPQLWQLFFYLGVMSIIIITKKKLALFIKWMLALLAVIVLLIRPEGDLKLTFLDVGQGDCIFIRAGGEGDFLIDGGSSSVSEVGTYRILPFLKHQGAHTLEAVFVTHADRDHCNGVMELLEMGRLHGIYVKRLVLPKIAKTTQNAAYDALALTARENGVEVLQMSRGQRIEAGKLSMTCMHPRENYDTQEANEYSMVLWLEYGSFRALLTGDVEGEGELCMEKYLEQIQPNSSLTVLKVAHHGSRDATTVTFLEKYAPTYAVISCSQDNTYGHPHKELLERLEENNVRWLRTDQSGAIEFYTDGEKLKVKVFQ